MYSTILFYQMQQTTISTNFPNKIQKMTRKVAKLLSQKYNIDDNSPVNRLTSLDKSKKDQKTEMKINQQDITNAFQKTQKMSTKLKLIRTMLGYEYESSQRKQKMRQAQHEQQKHPQERGTNLKQFVISMRKRNQLTDKYFKPRRVISSDQNLISFDPQSKNIQQYTDASLKYVHSFLPHHTMLEHSDIRAKKSSQFLTLTPQSQKESSPISRNSKYIETIQNYHSESGRLQSISSLQKKKPLIFKNKRSLTINNPNYNVASAKHSIAYISEVRKEQSPKNAQKKQSIMLPTVHAEPPLSQKQFKLISSTTPVEVYAARVTDLLYRGKNYNRQLKNHLRSNRDPQKFITSPENQEKKQIKQLLPIIKQCVPQTRNRQQGNTANR